MAKNEEGSPEPKKLDEALFKAQTLITKIGHDSNTSMYEYTSTEHMVGVCRKILHQCRLLCEVRSIEHIAVQDIVIVKTHIELRFINPEGNNTKKDYYIEIPLQSRGGMGNDKASLASQTSCLNYFFRNLLLIPRTNEEVCGIAAATSP